MVLVEEVSGTSRVEFELDRASGSSSIDAAALEAVGRPSVATADWAVGLADESDLELLKLGTDGVAVCLRPKSSWFGGQAGSGIRRFCSLESTTELALGGDSEGSSLGRESASATRLALPWT